MMNDNAVAALPIIDFGVGVNLGDIGNCISSLHVEQQLLNKEERKGGNGRPEKACCIGKVVHNNMTCENDTGDVSPEYRCIISNVTYLTENGNILTVQETIYSKDCEILLIVRTPDSTIAPSVSDIACFFDDDERAVLKSF